jgi:hypothetical protein
LEETKETKVWSAEKWKEYQIKNIETMFDAEKKQAEDEYKVTTHFLMTQPMSRRRKRKL